MKVEVKEKVAVKDPLYKVLKDVFGFESFKGSQEAIIRNLIAGKDTFVIMPTGSGKSLCYQLPAIISEGTAIVVSPLIALMKNQVDAIRNFGMELGLAHYLNSSLSRQELAQVKNDLAEGRTKLLYVAPESLTKDDNIELFKSIKISFYAIDEAHCISEWGHDFRPEYRRIRPMIEAIGQEVPVMALTATATPKVQQDIRKNLALMNATLFKTSFNRPNLYYEVRPKTESVLKDIIKYIKNQPGKSGIVYCLSRKKVEEVAEALQVNGIRAVPYHAGLDPQTRRENQDRFLMEDAEVVVATIAFGMGIDKPDIRYVIHHDIPKSLEGYYQETGRAGRDGGEGNCITFYSYDDILKLEKFLKNKHVAEQEITKLLLSETVAYAETTICRRKVLLHYFGEQYTQDNCGSCDNCLHPKTRYDGKEAVLTVLDAITQTKQQCKSKHLVHVITGKLTANVKAAKHHKLEVFAKGEEYDEPYWHSVIRQMLVENLIEKEIENLKSERKQLAEEHPLVWNIEFAEIFFEKGGFDIVIGNPPYVRQEDIDDPLGKIQGGTAYKNLLKEMVCLDFPEYFGTGRSISGRSDLYTYFFIRSLRILNPLGVHVFICSNSWLDVNFGTWLKEFLLKNVPLHFIFDNQAKRSFANADINTV
ncbi:MAG: ATP-dependent DNA helicase, partial [Bacteroidetes bacterium 38_7]